MSTATTVPPPCIDVKQYYLDDHHNEMSVLVERAIQPLLKQHGYVLLKGLESMTPGEMRCLMRCIAGEDGIMLKFNTGEYGSSCVSPEDFPEIRVLGKGVVDNNNALLCDVGYEWHQDGGGSGPFLTLLYCKIPCKGADTIFADGEILFQRLSDSDKDIARSYTAIYSNEYTAGGPTALDVQYGLRMSPCGTRRIRPSSQRKEGWTPGRFTRPLVEKKNAAVGGDDTERLLCGGKGLECIVGMEPDESAQEVSRLLRMALGPISEEGSLDDNLRTVGHTVFAPEAVYVHQWQAGEAILWDNHRLLHTTVPIACYVGESRLMWQIICKTNQMKLKISD